MHYEGTPPLWHLILFSLVRMHVPFAFFGWISAAFALAGVVVFVRYAPLPRIFSITLPFTFFFAYQYAAVARNYVLFPLLLFSLCIVYCAKKPKPVLFALVAGLFANLTTHALVLALCFSVLYAWDLLQLRRHREMAPFKPKFALATALLLVFVGFAVVVAIPAPDVGFAVESKVKKGPVHQFLAHFIPAEKLPAGAPPLDPDIFGPDTASPPHGAFHRKVWDEYNNPGSSGLPGKLLTKMVAILSIATFPVSESNLLACAFLILAGVWLWSRRSLSLLLPYVALLLFFAVIWVFVHHTGLSLLALLAAVWIAAGRPQTRGPKWISPLFAAVSLIVILVQIGWTIYAVRLDTLRPYDPGKNTYQFLAAHFPNARLASFVYETVDVQPYASQNLFINQPHSYRVFSSATNTDRRRTETQQEHPDAIVVADLVFGDEIVMNQWMSLTQPWSHIGHGLLDYWQDHGFHETHRFCGYRPFRLGISNVVCDVILEPNH